MVRLAGDANLRQELIAKGTANLARFTARRTAERMLGHLADLQREG